MLHWRDFNSPSADACDWKIQNGQKLPFTSPFYDKNLSPKCAGVFKKVSITRITKTSEGEKLSKPPLSIHCMKEPYFAISIYIEEQGQITGTNLVIFH